jgi:hypothetical protein
MILRLRCPQRSLLGHFLKQQDYRNRLFWRCLSHRASSIEASVPVFLSDPSAQAAPTMVPADFSGGGVPAPTK